MCGITAISRAEGRSSIPDARQFMRAALVAIESRGRHATGAAWADPTGWPYYWKQPGRARDVVGDAPLPTGMRVAIGHTRHATQGDPSVNDNNHPVVGDGLALVHNGRVDNDTDIFAACPDYVRWGDVDSEAFIALLASAATFGADHPTELLELVHGVASVAWVDASEPNILHLARLATRPLTVGWTRRGDLVMSSTRETMRDLSKLTRVAIGDVTPINEGTYLRVEAGDVTETRTFPVHAPLRAVPDDRPTRKPSKRKQRSYRQPVFDEIDWDNLVPRRGWK